MGLESSGKGEPRGHDDRSGNQSRGDHQRSGPAEHGLHDSGDPGSDHTARMKGRLTVGDPTIQNIEQRSHREQKDAVADQSSV